MPVVESDVHGTASSSSPPSPRCADVSVAAHSPDTRTAGCAVQRHIPEDSSANRRMIGRKGKDAQSLVRKDNPAHIFLGTFRAILTAERCTKLPILGGGGGSINLKKAKK